MPSEAVDSSAFVFDDHGAPQLAGDARVPPSCNSDVINSALRVASTVATKGVGEKQDAKGFLMVIGDRNKLMMRYGELGKPPEKEYNLFHDKGITIYEVETDGRAERCAHCHSNM